MPAINPIKLRQGTSATWASTNPVLASGEPGFDTTNKLLKIGDGTSTWTSLTNTASYSLLDVDNISLDANTISSTNSNGTIIIVPNGSGNINLDASTVRVGDSADIGATSTANLLLLRFDGNSNDSSIYARTVTAVGNATTSTVQKKFGTHAALFDGSGDRFDVPSSADFNLGASDHTIDFWMWINSSVNGTNERLVVFEGTTQTRGILIDNADKTKIGVNLFGTGYQILSATGAISNQTWIHVALVRSGSTTTLYVNGTSVGSTASQCLPTTNSSVSIGGNTVRFADNNFNGYIDEVRIVNSAVWTSNFTPPTSQYSQYLNPNATLTTAGTTNLLLNTNNGTNSGSITINQGTNGNINILPNGTGKVGIGTSSPNATIHVNGSGLIASGLILDNQTASTIASFDATKSLVSLSTSTYPSLTELSYLKGVTSAIQTQLNTIDCGVVTPSAGIVLNFNGSNGGTTFTNSGSLTGVTFSTSTGATTSTAQSKFGGSSLLCSGGNQWITGTADASLAHGTSDFTLEFWIYCITLTSSHYFFRTSTGTGTGDGMFIGAGATPLWYAGTNGSWSIANGLAMTGMTTGVWQHIAITRSGTTFRAFVNGTIVQTVTSASAVYQSANAFRIGAVNPSAGTGMNAYMDDFRYVSGYCAYTANFTPPTTELTSTV